MKGYLFCYLFGFVNYDRCYATNQLWLFRVVAWVWLIVAMLDFAICPIPRILTANRLVIQAGTLLWAIRCSLVAASAGNHHSVWSFHYNVDYLTVEELLFVTVSVGIASGMFCIPVAHELMHKRGRFDKILAEILMTSVSYTHFCIEHVHGHHRNVGTPMISYCAVW